VQDFAEAIKWLRKAADKGSPVAQYNLADLYQQGKGVKRDFEEACFWLALSEQQEFAPARAARQKLLDKLTSDQQANVDRRIRAWSAKKAHKE
jgi:TPR repeat protein